MVAMLGHKLQFSGIRHLGAEAVSQRVFYALLALSVVVFALFFLVGYDKPFEENPDFNAPLFTDALIGLMVLLLVGAVALAVASVVSAYRKNGRQEERVNGVPEGKIFRFTWLGTLLLLVLTFALGSSEPMLVNGAYYADWLWLKLSDMLVVSSVVLLLVAVGAVAFGATRYIRKERK